MSLVLGARRQWDRQRERDGKRQNQAHGAGGYGMLVGPAASRQQKDAFFRPNGAVVDTCGGKPCATRKFEP